MKENHTKTVRTISSLDSSPLATSRLLVDIIDACNLACTTCLRGRRYMNNTKNQMDFDVFKSIINKAVLYGFRICGLYNWTEPFLCKDLPIFTEYTQSQGLYCHLSSNLSFQHFLHIIPALKFTDELTVSVSGFTNATYQVNHRGGNIELVKENLRLIAQAKMDDFIKTDVVIKYFIFDYTEAEYYLFEKFAYSLGLKIIRYQAVGDPHAPLPPRNTRDEKHWLMQHGSIQRLPQHQTSLKKWMGKICYIAVQPVALDYNGNVSLCCHYPVFPSTIVGNFLEDDFDVIQYRRSTHPLCATCTTSLLFEPRPYHTATLLRGHAKTLGASCGSR